MGLDKDRCCVDTARRLAPPLQFQVLDAFREPVRLENGDLALGLHACGDVGDLLLTAGVKASVPIALVSCCPQKIRGQTRLPLSQTAKEAQMTLQKPVLGLANLAARKQGVESSLRQIMDGRANRYALRLLLEERGCHTVPGEEMHGINRRRAMRGLRDIASRALAMRRLPPPRPEELERCNTRARLDFPIIRRLSLPRAMLARVVEVAVVLDRACFLYEQGYDVRVGVLFAPSISPRNLAIVACRPP
jgi:hypothetical protein